MRFAIAVSVLAQLLRHVDSDVLLAGRARKFALQEAAPQKILVSSNRDGSASREILVKRILQQRRKDALRAQDGKSLDGIKPSWLSRISATQNSQAFENPDVQQECDPHQVDDAPDVGILSCGMNRYCVESEDSELGGICMDSSQSISRALQSYYISDWCEAPPENIACDCSEFVDGVGSIECVSDAPICLDQAPTICGIVTYKATYNADLTSDAGYCVEFTSGVTYDLLCYGYDFLSDGTAAACYIEIDNIPCDCTVIECPPGSTYAGESASLFDCTNTAANSTGSACFGDTFFPFPEPNITLSPTSPPLPGNETEPPVVTPAPTEAQMTDSPVAPGTEAPMATLAPTEAPMTDSPVAPGTEAPMATPAPTDMPVTGPPVLPTEAPSVAASLLMTTKVAVLTASALTITLAVSFAV